MICQSPAQIYKAQQRHHTEDNMHRLYATLNFGPYSEPSRTAFGSLQAVNDETLAPQYEIVRHPDGLVLLLPLVNELEYTCNGITRQVMPGEAAIITVAGELVLKNPYETELANFLYIVLSKEAVCQSIETISLNIRNTLHPFFNGAVKGFMGIFDGRQEAIYTLSNAANGLFIFIINGAFEVSGRLLEERDALALWHIEEADMEALSENAIIIVFEVPLQGLTS